MAVSSLEQTFFLPEKGTLNYLVSPEELEKLSRKPEYDQYLSRKNGLILKVRNNEGSTEYVRANLGGRWEYIQFISREDFISMKRAYL